ncbi:Fc receptor-like protein 5 [Psammomys obesus]|uniref:Fc receptor-like protein 5 n=1 Tax=Psammomys obesus TaxID=48139 RepID=UPI002452FA0F|nr:Fc receptor-like protein 5 [Psammomys obesus]
MAKPYKMSVLLQVKGDEAPVLLEEQFPRHSRWRWHELHAEPCQRKSKLLLSEEMPGPASARVVFTLLWPSLTLLAVETAPKSMIFLQPPWTTFFQGETVTLSCYRFGFSLPLKTKWYQKRKPLKETQRNTLSVRESGEYWCQADGSPPSIHVHVEFSEDPLVLQAPPAVFEGDPVVLRCHAKESIPPETLKLYKNDEALSLPGQSSELHIPHANLGNNGEYKCSGKKGFFRTKTSSKTFRVQVQELFPRPVLTARPSHPIDGSPVTLTCRTQLPAQRSAVQLRFCFFRNLQALGTGCSNSSEFHIPAIWTEESKWYQCKAETMSSQAGKQSVAARIPVQRAFADFQINIVPASKLVFEGQLLLFNCSVKGVPGPLKFSWYKRDKLNKEAKTHKSSEAEFKISTVNSSDAGDYYCEANNSRRSFVSGPVPITIKVPVSRPVLTLRVPGAQAVVGMVVQLSCEALRGSPPILYHFYHRNVTLGSSSAPSGGRGSFNFSVTVEHFGNFFCEADNGQGRQRSDTVTLNVIHMTKNRSVAVATGLTGGLATLAAGVLLFHCWFSRKAGGKPASDDSRSPSAAEAQEPTYYNAPACIELQPAHSSDTKEDVIYTEVWSTPQRDSSKNKPEKRLTGSYTPGASSCPVNHCQLHPVAQSVT